MQKNATMKKLRFGNGESTRDRWEVSAVSKDIEGEVVVPGYYKNESVVIASGRPDFGNYSKLIAFKDCIKLTDVVLLEGVEEIEGMAFDGCTGLTKVELPKTLVAIGWRAFANCTELEEIVIPEGVTYIDDEAFLGCVKLNKVTLPSSLVEIGRNVFANTAIYNNTADGEVVYVDNWVVDFKGKRLGNHLELRQGIVGICTEAFGVGVKTALAYWRKERGVDVLDNRELESVALPDTLKYINAGAFANCKKIENIDFPDSLLELDEKAFLGCERLSSVRLSKSLKNIMSEVFKDTALLDKDNEEMVYQQGWVLRGPLGRGEVILPSETTNFASSAFYGNSQIERVVIPKGVEEIPSYTFMECVNLKTLEIEGEIKSIGSMAFYESAIDKIDLSKTEEIENCAFENCKNLQSIKLNGTIGEEAFSNCTGLKEVNFGEVSEIERSAFHGCTSLLKIDIPGSIKELPRRVFSDCTALESVVIAEGVESIDEQAFCNCKNLSKLVLPNSIKNIGKNAFKGVRLTDAVIPAHIANMSATGLMFRKDLSQYVISQLTVCFTGKLKAIKRAEAEEMVIKAGGQIAKGINKKVNLVVAGADAGDKLNKADELMIDIIDEMEFLTIMGKINMKETMDMSTKTFEMAKDFYYLLKDKIAEYELTVKHQDLVEEFIKVNAAPCYSFEEVEGTPGALDTHTAGIPYCPVGEELPTVDGEEIPLLLQVNFEGVDLPGYPNKGILQLFAGHPTDEEMFPIEDEGVIARYYPEIGEYRKDIPTAVNALAKTRKLKLKRDWSIFNLMYSDFIEDFEEERPKEAKIIAKMRELEDDDYMQGCASVLNDLMPRKSNIGGYAGATPQGNWQFPKDTLLYLQDDLIDWGDGGAIFLYYKDITTIEKDEQIEVAGDMS